MEPLLKAYIKKHCSSTAVEGIIQHIERLEAEVERLSTIEANRTKSFQEVAERETKKVAYLQQQLEEVRDILVDRGNTIEALQNALLEHERQLKLKLGDE